MIWVSVPERNLNHIRVLTGHRGSLDRAIDLEVVLRLHQEVKLVKVEGVVFQSSVLNNPSFDSALRGNDVRRRVRIENMLGHTLDGHEERACRVDFVKEHRTLRRNRLGS